MTGSTFHPESCHTDFLRPVCKTIFDVLSFVAMIRIDQFGATYEGVNDLSGECVVLEMQSIIIVTLQ